MDTSLAETMKLVEDRERYDECAKKIISHKAIIAWILIERWRLTETK